MESELDEVQKSLDEKMESLDASRKVCFSLLPASAQTHVDVGNKEAAVLRLQVVKLRNALNSPGQQDVIPDTDVIPLTNCLAKLRPVSQCRPRKSQ